MSGSPRIVAPPAAGFCPPVGILPPVAVICQTRLLGTTERGDAIDGVGWCTD